MILIVIFYFIFICATFFFVKRNYALLGYKEYSIVNPINIVLLYSLIGIPYMFYIIFDPSLIYTPIAAYDLDYLIVKYISIQVFLIFFFIIGGLSVIHDVLKFYLNKLDKITVINTNYLLTFLLLTFYLLFIYNQKQIKVSDIFEIFLTRGDTVSKLGYIFYVQQLIAYYVLYVVINREKLSLFLKLNLLLFFAMFLFSSLISGGRTQIVYLFVFGFLVMSNKNKDLIKNIFKPKYLLMIVFFGVIFFVLPKLRNANVLSDGLMSLVTTREDDVNNYKFHQLLSDLSGLDRYLFVIDIFDKNRLWLGDGYADIFRILLYPILGPEYFDFLPKGDDGLYLAVMSNENRFLFETFRVDDEYKTSFPPGNYAAYMNFGVVGLIVAYYLLGAIAKALFLGCEKNRFKYIYFYTLFISGSIAFSNICILSTIINGITLFALFIIVLIISPRAIKILK